MGARSNRAPLEPGAHCRQARAGDLAPLDAALPDLVLAPNTSGNATNSGGTPHPGTENPKGISAVHEEGLEPSSLAAPEPKPGDMVAREREWSRNAGERGALGDQRRALATGGGGSVPNQGSARAGALATLAGELARLSAGGGP